MMAFGGPPLGGGHGRFKTGCKMLREAMGDDVIDHYHHAAMWEQEDFDRRVTDYEVSRGFERA